MKVSTIKQSAVIPASPEKVYSALMSSKTHSKFTGGKAMISTKVGGKFSAYEGYAYGKNLKLEKGKRIVQTWRAMEPHWPDDHFSVVEYKLVKVKGGTRINFTQKSVPSKVAAAMRKGWKTYYWLPLKQLFSQGA